MTVEATPAAPESPPADRPQENVVAEERRKREKAEQEAKEAREELNGLSTRLQQIEDRDKSEVERERSARERAEQERNTLTDRLTKLERGGWVRQAAQEASFVDPEDAVVHVDLSDIESERDAERAVKRLADRKKHLVQDEQRQPQVGQVPQPGQPRAAGPQVSEADERLLADIQTANQDAWSTAAPLFPQQ